MEKILIIHGRQPSLGRAELESICGAEKVRTVGTNASLVDIEPKQFNFARFGGMVKFCKVLLELNTVDWAEIAGFLCQAAPEQSKNLEEGRLTIGLSVYGLKTNVQSINNAGIKIKKAVKATGRSVRIVPNKELALNSAQVLHNKLTDKLGWELVFMRNGGKTIVAQSIAVQDIEKYAARDQNRPYRDAKVGMLPPKLAQIIINMAVGPSARPDLKVCDAFCGTGVILQEALLMGYSAIGSDIDPRMIEYSKKNLEWLTAQGSAICPGGVEPGDSYTLSVADATKVKLDKQDTVASEIFLGMPLSSLPKSEILAQINKECGEILEKFLKNVSTQTKSGFRMCLAVPAWKTKNGFKHLRTLDKLPDLGYNRLKFVHVSNEELVYHRPGQIVARELVVIERK